MRGVMTVFWFTFREFARKKSFIISTIVILALVAGGLCVPSIINRFNEAQSAAASAGNNSQILYLVDPSGVLTSGCFDAEHFLSGYKLEIKSAADVNNLKKAIQKDDSKALILVSMKNGVPSFEYDVKKSGNGPGPDTVADAIRNAYATQMLQKGGTPTDTIAKVLSPVDYTVKELGKSYLSGIFSSILITILLFFSIYLYGYWVAMSIASEKTSRVMELLVTSTKPSRIVIGKSAAMGALGLGQLALILLTAVGVYTVAFPRDFTLLGEQLNFNNVTPFALLMAIIYFILGFALYAMLNAVVGSTVSKAEDVQSAMMPVSMVSLLSFYLAYTTMFMPESPMASVISVIPFSAAFSMPARLMSTEVPPLDICLSVGLLIITIILLAWLSIKIYSSAVLHYGKRLKISELLKLSNTKQA